MIKNIQMFLLQLLAELTGQRVQLGFAGGVQSGFDRDGRVREGEILALFKKTAHDFGGVWHPTAVLDQGDGAVLEVAFRQMRDERVHEWEDFGIVRRGREHELTVLEGGFHRFGHVVTGKIEHFDVAAFGFQLLDKQLDGFLGMSVDGRVGDGDAGGFNAVGGPCVVEVQIVAEILREDGAMCRADDGDVQFRGFLEERLDLRTVFSDDADVITAGFARPAFRIFDVVRAELAEAVRGEEDFVLRVIGDDDFRPMDHGGGHEGERMLAEGERVAFGDDDAAVFIVCSEEVLHHRESLGGGDDGRRLVGVHEGGDVARVVRLHVVDDQIVGGFAAEHVFDVAEPFVAEADIDGVDDGGLAVNDGV